MEGTCFHLQVRDENHQQGFLSAYFPEPDFSVTPVSRTFPEIRANMPKQRRRGTPAEERTHHPGTLVGLAGSELGHQVGCLFLPQRLGFEDHQKSSVLLLHCLVAHE